MVDLFLNPTLMGCLRRKLKPNFVIKQESLNIGEKY